MTTLAATKAFSDVGVLTKKFDFKQSDKSISTFKKIICITTDRTSVQDSDKLVKHLTGIKKSLPVKDEQVNVVLIKKNITNINESIFKINNFFEVIASLFDGQSDVKIDDPNMIALMANMNNAKILMEYISDYLNLILDVHKSKLDIKNGTAKKYLIEDLIASLAECELAD